MITEDYVSFETAKLLKEKGFDIPCNCYGTLNSVNLAYRFCLTDKYTNWNKHFDKTTISCPTLQMAVKWLRKIYKLEVRSTYDYDKDSWWGNIYPMFEETDENSDNYQKALRFDKKGKSYEEVCEAAIKYCLESLI